jgi:acyl dehydratase
MLVYRVQAINTATASSNKMHDDSVAKQYGFAGGLVPGVDVWAYLCHLPAEAWGRAWLAEGGLNARFVAPIYDGEEVTIEAVEAGEALEGGEADDVDSLDITARNRSGQACAVGRAYRRISGPPPDVGAYPSAPLPEPPPPAASPEYFNAHPVLGTCHATWHAGAGPGYLDSVNEHLALFRDGNVAPPGWLLRRANDVLFHNVTLGPWIHVESRVRHLGVVNDGAVVSTRARTADAYERKGHRFVELDVLMLADGDRPVFAARHVAIYQPRRTNSPSGPAGG